MKKNNNPLPKTASPLFSKVLLVVNPTAGLRSKRKKLGAIIDHLRQTADHLEIVYTAAALDATRLIKERRKEAWTLILCAGGDGTINEVVNGLMDEEGSSILPPIGILPTGTGNGLAREIGLPLRPWKAYQALLTGAPKAIYPGKVFLKSEKEEAPKGRYFVLLAGAGFDAYVAQWVERRSFFFRQIPKLWVYILFGLVALFFYRYPTVQFSIDGRPLFGSTGVIARARLVAGPFTFAPASDLGSRSLLLCLLKQRGIIGYFRILFQLFLRGTPGREVEYVWGKEIEAFGTTEGVQADGEFLGPLPALFTHSERPLYLLYPSSKK